MTPWPRHTDTKDDRVSSGRAQEPEVKDTVTETESQGPRMQPRLRTKEKETSMCPSKDPSQVTCAWVRLGGGGSSWTWRGLPRTFSLSEADRDALFLLPSDGRGALSQTVTHP